MDLDSARLRAFQAVARTGGFSRAAATLHRTQPAVSQAIRALEEDVGEALFLRLGRKVALTAAGEILLEQADEAFAALDVARDRLRALRDLESGELVIGTSDTNACYLLPPVLAAFRERHPGIEVRISNRPSPATEIQVLEREVDVGFVTLPVGIPQLRAEPLTVREDVAIFAPDHRLARRRRIRFVDLLGDPLLLLDHGSRTRSLIDEQLAAHPGEGRIAMELASIEVVKRLVALGFGVSVVPRISVEAEVAQGTLACASLFARADARSLGVVYPARVPLSRAASVFVALAREILDAGAHAGRPQSSPARSR
jgi:DNA-binding transcriptional LysR family regulator